MTRQTTEAYEDIFSFLKSYGINFKEIVLDFEYASRKAVLRSFPGIEFIEMIFGLNFESFLEEESKKQKDDFALDLNHFLESPLNENEGNLILISLI